MRETPLQAWHVAQGASAGVRDYGDPQAEYRFVTGSVGLFDASARDRFVVSGEDRLSFVQGLCSNDVELLPVGRSLEAAFITPKGKLVADCRITKLEDALVFELEAGRAAALIEVFAKYRIHEAVEWSDASEELAQLELWGPKAAEALGEGALAENVSAAVMIGEGAFLAVGTVFGAVVYVPAPAAEETAAELRGRAEALGGGLAGHDAIELRRIELGLGKYGVDWDENTNPLEAGLDRAIDYKKGCYVGQEVVAKATYIGRVNRRLVRLEWDGAPVPPGTPLLGGKSPGRVTSASQVPGSTRTLALGIARRDVAVAGSRLQVGEGGPEATVRGYPYRSKEKPTD